MARDKIATANGVDAATISAAEVKAFMERPEEIKNGRAKARSRWARSSSRRHDLPSGALWHGHLRPRSQRGPVELRWRQQVGRVLDTKAAVHERYAGGPRDTAFSCIVDVRVAVARGVAVQINPDTKADTTGYLLEPSERSSGGRQTSTLANTFAGAQADCWLRRWARRRPRPTWRRSRRRTTCARRAYGNSRRC